MIPIGVRVRARVSDGLRVRDRVTLKIAHYSLWPFHVAGVWVAVRILCS